MTEPVPPCEESPDGWCLTCSTADGPIYHADYAGPQVSDEDRKQEAAK